MDEHLEQGHPDGPIEEVVTYWPGYAKELTSPYRFISGPWRVNLRRVVDYMRTSARSRDMLRAQRALER